MSHRLEIIDFHNHFVPRGYELSTPASGEWVAIRQHLQDEAAVLRDLDSGDVDVRVLNSPAALVKADTHRGADTIIALNDALANFVSRHPGRLHGLASVDIFDGERAAREIERGVRSLGFLGVFVDSARGDVLIDAPEARPGLVAAHELGIPVFVHPINPPGLTERLAGYGRSGTRLARGTVNGAALLALLHGGVYDELPDLRVVITGLAIGALQLEAAFNHDSAIRRDAKPERRRHVFVDTIGLDAGLLKTSVDIVGADHVLLGSDWPIVSHGPIRDRVQSIFDAAGIDAATAELIASGNTRRLLGLPLH